MEMRDRVAEAKELRRQGFSWGEIGGKIGVSGTMTSIAASERTSANNRNPERENALPVCNIRRPDYRQTCQRTVGHEGIHLSDEGGKLLWWS